MIDEIFKQEVENQKLGTDPKTDGIILVDVSGSMLWPVGEYSRLQLAALICNDIKSRAKVEIYATAGSDTEERHLTEKVPDEFAGYQLWLSLKAACNTMGGGGIFVDQAIEYISHYSVKPKCLYIISDDQLQTPTKQFWKEELSILNVSRLKGLKW